MYPFVPGQDGFCVPLTDQHWITLGKALRQVHEVDLPHALKIQIRREDFSPKWRNAVRSIYKHIHIPIQDFDIWQGELINFLSVMSNRVNRHSAMIGREIGERFDNGKTQVLNRNVYNIPSFEDEIALKLWEFLQGNKPVIQQLVDRSEALCQKACTVPYKLAFCHADIHAGNVLVSGEAIYIVDWDDPILAPKERDLMFIGGGIGNTWNHPHEETLFYEGYGQTEIDQTLLAYYRYERIVEDIAVYCQELLFEPTKSGNRLKMYGEFMNMFKPNGVVDIAFATDKTFHSRK